MSKCPRCDHHQGLVAGGVCFFCCIAMYDESKMLGAPIGRDLWPIEGVSQFQAGSAV